MTNGSGDEPGRGGHHVERDLVLREAADDLGHRIGRYEVGDAVPTAASTSGATLVSGRDPDSGEAVVLEILPEDQGGSERDPEWQRQLTREADRLGTLDHPSIETPLDVLESNGRLVLVKQAGAGLSGEEWLSRAPLPENEWLEAFRQLASALEVAHERGIVHGRLGSGSLRVALPNETNDLELRITDLRPPFAVALDEESSKRPLSELDLSHTPTRTLRAGSVPGFDARSRTFGVFPGHEHAAPEQVAGLPIDHRIDIWAFGCLLYQALCGVPANNEPPLAEPDWSRLPEALDPRVGDLVRRCLRSDRLKRLQHIGDARVVLDELAREKESDTSKGLSEPGSHGASGSGWRSRAPWPIRPPRPGARGRGRAWAIATALGIAAFVAGFAASSARDLGSPERSAGTSSSTADGEVIRFTLREPTATAGFRLDISPDGRRIAYDGTEGLMLRELGGGTRVVAAEGGNPWFSRDGEELAFDVYDPAFLRRVSLRGGRPEKVGRAGNMKGAAWARDGTLVWTPFTGSGLLIREPGQEERILTRPSGLDHSHRYPHFLPGDRKLLFSVPELDSNRFHIEALDLETGERQIVVENGSGAIYVEALGVLLFNQEETLLAARFDPDRLELISDPVEILSDVPNDSGRAAYAVSETGTLVYRSAPGRVRMELALRTIDGELEPIALPWSNFSTVALSPDGQKVLIHAWEMTSPNFILDLASGAVTPRDAGLRVDDSDLGAGLALGGLFVRLLSLRDAANRWAPAVHGADRPESPARETHCDRSRALSLFDEPGRRLSGLHGARLRARHLASADDARRRRPAPAATLCAHRRVGGLCDVLARREVAGLHLGARW